MPRVLLVANTSWYIYNFRFPLLLDLRKKGYNVSVVAPHDKYTKAIEKEGFKVINWEVSRSSVNPLIEAKALLNLIKIYRRNKPDLVHHFTIKACLYGTISAKLSRIYRVINAVTGLGHIFLGKRKRHQILRRSLEPIYRGVFKARRSTVVFQNADDQEKLIQLGITNTENSRLIHGSGVDIEKFKPLKDSAGLFQDPIQILFPSRLIKQKGLLEVLEACKTLWSENCNFELLLAGDLDKSNHSSLSRKEIAVLQTQSKIRCLGHVRDMRTLYASSDLVVLPSWREGLSRSLIEAASMERPIITTDTPGCRDVVDHGRSGLIVPLRDAPALTLAIRLLIENPDLARKFGKAARQKVMAEFQVSIINKRTLEQYEYLLNKPIKRKNSEWFLPSPR